ncbi:MAG: DNA gyrase inhibitor YacG [Candidatus Brocadiia bacterium]
MAEEFRIQCPNCGRTVVCSQEQQVPHFPFCSRRCRLLDLGKWLDEEHRIERPLPDAPPTQQGEDQAGQAGD